MAGQTKQVRGHHASRLLGLLRSAGPVGEDGEAAQLQALLVAMSEPDVAGGSSGTDGADGWLMQWVHQLGCHLPALQLDHAAVIDDSLDEEALLAAGDEAEAQLASGGPPETDAVLSSTT